MTNPTPDAETLDEVAPRLTRCMAEVVARLRDSDIQVETLDTFLLDSSQHRIEVPCRLDGVPVEMNFFASLPAWSDTICAHLQVMVTGGRRWSVYETRNGLRVSRIVQRICKELERCKKQALLAAEQTDQKVLAARRFADLVKQLGLPAPDGLSVLDSGLEIRAIEEMPDRVRVTLFTPHAEVLKIAALIRRFGGPRKKS